MAGKSFQAAGPPRSCPIATMNNLHKACSASCSPPGLPAVRMSQGFFFRHGFFGAHTFCFGWLDCSRAPLHWSRSRRTLDDPFCFFPRNMHAKQSLRYVGDDDDGSELASRDAFCPAERSFEASLSA